MELNSLTALYVLKLLWYDDDDDDDFIEHSLSYWGFSTKTELKIVLVLNKANPIILIRN